ncbi:MAG TPA: VWA domain-containing protein, partial [Polyangiaceae bacterium]|nr:VWA domain-containing protein [Polyangiaceae bacterium]
MMSELAHFHFLRPGWLLIALPALVVAVLRLVRTRPSQKWARFIAPHLLEHLLSRPSHSPWLSPEVMLFPCALVFAVALAGPAYQLADAPNGPDDTTLIVVVDLSSSMAGRDIGPSRIGRLKLKLRDLIDLRRGSRVGVIAVAGSAHVVMPPTDDTDALIPYLNVLAPDLMPSDGEHFAQAVPLIEQLLAQRGGPSVVLVAADSLPPDGATALAALQHKGVTVVGWVVGTEHGVPSAGVPGVDRVGFSALGRAGATVVDLTLGESDVRHLDALLDAARTAQVDPKDATLWQDAGYGLSF